MNLHERIAYQAELRRLKDARPKCDRRDCNEPSTLRSVLCRGHLKEHDDRMRALSRSYDKFGEVPQPKVYVCDQCGDETDDPHNLCKCGPE